MSREAQKSESRRRIIEAASRVFRERGYGGTSVDQLMGEAGLTRGGFYAHFRDKSEVFAAAIVEGFAQAAANLVWRGGDDLSGEAWIARARRRYLRMGHVRDRAEGCAAASLGSGVSRLSDGPRETFEGELSAFVDSMAQRIGGDGARARAWRLLSQWSGALVLARAVRDPALAEEILAASREE